MSRKSCRTEARHIYEYLTKRPRFNNKKEDVMVENFDEEEMDVPSVPPEKISVNFKEKLAEWAIKFNISGSALNELLLLLKSEVPEIPIDYRSLKQTPRDGVLVHVAGGDYMHYGVVDSLTDFFSSNQYKGTSISLNINIDGLPLFKSSKMQDPGYENRNDYNDEGNKNVNSELKEEIKKLQTDNDITNKRLITEIISLKKQINNNINAPSIIPRNPFTNKEDFQAFDTKMKCATDQTEQLEEEFYKICIHNPSKFIREAWKRLMTDETAKEFTWRGTSSKLPIRNLTVTNTLRAAFNRRFSMGQREFDAVSIKWFQTASDRIKSQKTSH